MSDKENIEELRVLLGNGLEMMFDIHPRRFFTSSVQKKDYALAYEKLNELVQGMTKLCETVEELLMLVKK